MRKEMAHARFLSFPVIEPLDLIGHWEDIREAWK